MDNELISVTTRSMRQGEVEGSDYHFITNEEYIELFFNDDLIEYTEYSGNYYGLTKDELNNKLSKGNAFVIVDRNGAQQLLDSYDNCVTIILHTTKEDAVRQMKDRGDSDESIEQRMITYKQEIKNKDHYDYAVVNRYGEFEKARSIIKEIVELESVK